MLPRYTDTSDCVVNISSHHGEGHLEKNSLRRKLFTKGQFVYSTGTAILFCQYTHSSNCVVNIYLRHGGEITWEVFETLHTYPIPGESILLYLYTHTNDCVVNISSHLSNKYQFYHIFLVSKGEYGSFTLLVHPYPERKLLTKGQFYYIFIDLKGVGILQITLQVHQYR